MFDFQKIREGALAAIASVILTATAVGAAVGPARAVETTPIAYAALVDANSANG
jgi:hypothetical protein